MNHTEEADKRAYKRAEKPSEKPAEQLRTQKGWYDPKLVASHNSHLSDSVA